MEKKEQGDGAQEILLRQEFLSLSSQQLYEFFTKHQNCEHTLHQTKEELARYKAFINEFITELGPFGDCKTGCYELTLEMIEELLPKYAEANRPKKEEK